MIGILGFVGWKVTVISSNFIALMLILNMAMNIHVTVRFLQLKKEFPQMNKKADFAIQVKKCSYQFSIQCLLQYVHFYLNF